MLAHLSGDMCKHVALSRKIDPKHRARQHLCHRAFGQDLFFLCHRPNILPTGALLNQRGQFAILLGLFQRNGRQIFAEFLTFPPCASLSMFFRRSESITKQDRADIARWLIWKWVIGKQPSDIRLSLEQTNGEPDKPGNLLWCSQRGEPHLPIEPWLMWRAPARGAVYGARFPFEFVRQPIDPIGAAFDYNLATIFRHYAKQAVAVHNPERFDVLVSKRESPRPRCIRLKCSKNEPSIDGQRNDEHNDRTVYCQVVL